MTGDSNDRRAKSQFLPMPERLKGELEERIAWGRSAMRFHNAFLDDYLRGILPHDLVCLGAPTGAGKTDLVLGIGAATAETGKPVYTFALEAERRELERRKKFGVLASLVYQHEHPLRHELNFDDWVLGRQQNICGDFEPEADAYIAQRLSTFHTLYREEKFDAEDLARSLVEIRNKAALIIVDHLHYVDNDEEDEHRAMGDIVKLVRDISLRIGKPIILVAHLRKRPTQHKRIFVDEHDFHGTSSIVKICTQVISLQPATDLKPKHWSLAPTYIQILKHRRSGRCPLVAVANFDRRSRLYQSTYSLGRSAQGGTKWEPLKHGEEPPWASKNGNHRVWDAGNNEPTAQGELGHTR